MLQYDISYMYHSLLMFDTPYSYFSFLLMSSFPQIVLSPCTCVCNVCINLDLHVREDSIFVSSLFCLV